MATSSAGSTTVVVDGLTTGKAMHDVVRAYGGRCTNARRRTPSAVTTHTRLASLRRCRAQILKHKNQSIRARLRLKQKLKTLVDPKGFVSRQQARSEGDQ